NKPRLKSRSSKPNGRNAIFPLAPPFPASGLCLHPLSLTVPTIDWPQFCARVVPSPHTTERFLPIVPSSLAVIDTGFFLCSRRDANSVARSIYERNATSYQAEKHDNFGAFSGYFRGIFVICCAMMGHYAPQKSVSGTHGTLP